MPRVSWGARVGWVVAMTTAGCTQVQPSGLVPGAPGVRARPLTPVMLGRAGERDSAVLASFEVPAAARPRGSGGSGPVFDLGSGDCQCLCARNSTAANLLELKRRELLTGGSGSSHRCREHAVSLPGLEDELLFLAAREARNRSAGEGLELFYRLAGAEAKRCPLRQGIAEVDDALAKLEQAKRRGLPPPVDEADLRRRRLALLDDELELQLGLGQLNAALRTLIEPPPGDPGRIIRPVAPGPSGEALPDEANAVAIGLARRPELLALRRLQQALDVETLPAARRALASADPLLGIEPPRPHSRGLRRRKDDESDLAEVRDQLASYAAARERTIAEEIAQAVRNVRARRQQVEVARRQVASWSAEVEKAQARTAQGLASFAVALPAKAGLLQARQAQVEHEVAWNVALVKLKQAQGLLADECDAAPCARPHM